MLTEFASFPARAFANLSTVLGRTSKEFRLNDSPNNFTTLLKSIEDGHREAASTNNTGWLKMRVERIEVESDNVKSFYLTPTSNRPLASFQAGQHIIVSNADHKSADQAERKSITRCYTLSGTANPRQWRISVKRQNLEPVYLAESLSHYLHDYVKEGDVLQVKGPRGHFTIQKAEQSPILLFGAGIGVTPVIAMATSLANQDDRRPIWVFYQTQCPEQAALAGELIALAKRCRNLRLNIAFSQLESTVQTAQSSNIQLFGGRIAADQLAAMSPHTDIGHCFLCGPGQWMQSTILELEARGFSKDRIHYESFGSVMVTSNPSDQPNAEVPTSLSAAFTVTCRDAKLSVNYHPQQGSLLDQLQKAGATVAGGCRVGNCGTCMTKLVRGQVNPGQSNCPDLQDGWILPCVASPTSEIELEV